MIAARAHSFVLQARLAISLAAVAGYANVVAFLVCGVVVSHVTGHATHFGRDLAQGQWNALAFLLALLVAFFMGAFLSGLSTEIGRRRGWASIYVLPAAIEICLLVMFAIAVRMHDPDALGPGARSWLIPLVASMAMGVQNATITRISSGIVRTTHLTGILTDLGHESAQLALFRRWLGDSVTSADAQHGGPSVQRLALLASIFVAFVGGGTLGTLAHGAFPAWSMVPPIGLLAWIIIADMRTPICELQETPLADVRVPHATDGSIAFFRAVPTRAGAAPARLPDLGAWIACIEPGKRTVIVDLTGTVTVTAPAVRSITDMMDRGRRDGRRVIVIGISTIERVDINALAHRLVLDERDIAADLRHALALLTPA